ncbi:hypothetical protein BOW51_04570 [Solemya velesiana gill symbiont]|uniref:Diguanylate cyclase n=1 Tax=Solemya velesiana gill symbiont TaxID=1918948 RepID=A0A1T2KVT5_9GAMM|nr:diguanylate cyclase [Solemya velesiana gill symbiont]OOZ36955.1 hypothetical protein BOW51_04570 [Solemya velesiana gill symbiont]
MSGVPVFDEQGGFLGYRGTAANITERVDAQDQLRLAATVFESTVEGVMVADLEGTIIAVNKAFTEITGYSEAEALGQKPSMLRSQRHDEKFYSDMWASITETGQWRGEIWNRRKNGEVYPQWMNISAVKNDQSMTTRLVSVFTDITPMKQSEERLAHLAHHDALTGLPNRLLFSALLEHSLERVVRNNEQVAVLFLDLDLFKNINDSFGHPMGDRLLQLAAERLSATVRDEDTVARLGGDEFIMLLERVSDMQAAATVSDKILHELNKPFEIEGHKLYVTGSIGISISPNDSTDADVLIKNADAAMYRAKDLGRGNYCFYTKELTSSAMERVVLERELRHALEQDQLVVHYQPQYSLKSGKLVGAEALVRWQHPERGLISPDSFIHVAEECGLILPLGEWVLRASCHQMQEWIEAGLEIGRVSVNVSGQQIERYDLVSMVQKSLEESGLKPWNLELEITESCIMQEAESAIRALTELKSMGVRLAVDDFGTGYSSLLEGLIFSLPIIAIEWFVGSLGQGIVNGDAHFGLVWLLSLVSIIAILSGVSQLHYLGEIIVKSAHDPMTGAFNRGAGEELLEKYYLLAERNRSPLTLIFIDLDHFKSINDQFGHEAGDDVLVRAVQNMLSNIRKVDLLIRWGGEEFVIVAPYASVADHGVIMAHIADVGLGERPDGRAVTASVGCAEYLNDQPATLAQFVECADKRMYLAKQAGRNRICYGDAPEVMSNVGVFGTGPALVVDGELLPGMAD